ncbi:ELWxxDGT repeat protein [Emticicia sp. SJ17W-69]|uniref:ELWxxDGT repeat protein n=1 Tax=Emticicia sp. SJ17W-69 TaxID=3421657 RepID=UPI003EB9BC82
MIQNKLYNINYIAIPKAVLLHILIICLIPFFAISQTLQLVKDINSNFLPSSSPTNFININGILYFSATNQKFGMELYRSDGTLLGTKLVKDINQGLNSSNPTNFTNINGTLYFSANIGSGYDLWKSDGTDAGTVLVKDIYNEFYSYPKFLTNVNGTLFFTAGDEINGTELWKSDGTEAGTVMIKNILSGRGGSAPENLFNHNGVLYFFAYHNLYGYELWKSDGTEAGTVMVKDIYTGPNSSHSLYYPNNFVSIDNTLYFTANNGINGSEVWKTNGTDLGTVMVKDIYVGADNGVNPAIDRLINMNGNIYFYANDGNFQEELWRSDGTEAGTVMVKDIAVGSNSSYPRDITKVNSTLFFSAANGINGVELWKSDGTAVGTVMVKDIYENDNSYINSPKGFVDLNGTLYFVANNGINGYELWKSNGTNAGTTLIKDIYEGTNSAYDFSPKLFALGNTLFFSANNGINGYELWKSNGKEESTLIIKDINVESSTPSNLINVNNILYLSANDGKVGQELWKSDGTAVGTTLVKDINIGAGNSNISMLGTANNNLFFNANDGNTGLELWSSMANNTQLVKDFFNGYNEYSRISYFASINNIMYLSVTDNGVLGTELWRTDGTPAGTVLVKDIWPGSGSSEPKFLTNLNNTLYFLASNPETGFLGLWKSDGTSAGTLLVRDTGGIPREMINVNGTLFWTTINNQIWKSDGTEAGTVPVKTIPSAFSNDTYFLTNVNGTLFFVSNNGLEGGTGSGVELWKSDGTEAGTVLVKNINLTGNSYPRDLVDVNGVLYFYADDGIHGMELWKSNGTEAGTVLVKDINIGTSNSSDGTYPFDTYLTNLNGTLYFVANNGVNGRELWKSDGTTIGTVMVNDMSQGIESSTPKNLTKVNDALYFSADDGIYGNELWKLTPPPCPVEIILQSPTNDYTNGILIQEVNRIIGTIAAANKITNTAKVTYRAGKSITLHSGFMVDSGAVFKTEFGGCNN